MVYAIFVMHLSTSSTAYSGQFSYQDLARLITIINTSNTIIFDWILCELLL